MNINNHLAIKEHVKLLNDLQITMKENCEKIPIIHWIPKFHKNPMKPRFIVNSKNSTLLELDTKIFEFLSTLKSHFSKYCTTILINTGI